MGAAEEGDERTRRRCLGAPAPTVAGWRGMRAAAGVRAAAGAVAWASGAVGAEEQGATADRRGSTGWSRMLSHVLQTTSAASRAAAGALWPPAAAAAAAGLRLRLCCGENGDCALRPCRRPFRPSPVLDAPALRKTEPHHPAKSSPPVNHREFDRRRSHRPPPPRSSPQRPPTATANMIIYKVRLPRLPVRPLQNPSGRGIRERGPMPPRANATPSNDPTRQPRDLRRTPADPLSRTSSPMTSSSPTPTT